jgi:hypothetical protein
MRDSIFVVIKVGVRIESIELRVGPSLPGLPSFFLGYRPLLKKVRGRAARSLMLIE